MKRCVLHKLLIILLASTFVSCNSIFEQYIEEDSSVTEVSFVISTADQTTTRAEGDIEDKYDYTFDLSTFEVLVFDRNETYMTFTTPKMM